MIAAVLLLLLAILSGSLLTFLFDRDCPPAARLCMGAAIGLALWSTSGFLLSLLFGLGGLSLALSALVMAAPLIFLRSPGLRGQVAEQIAAAREIVQKAVTRPEWRTVGYFAYYLAIILLLGVVFSRAVYQNQNGLYTAVVNNLGDLPLHLQATSSFVDGKNLPPQDPTYSGVRFAYPFQCDFLTAMLVKSGAGITSAFWLQNMTLALALVGLLHYWTLLLTGNKTAGVIAPALLLLSGGLGWTFIFDEVRNSESGIIPLLGHLTHDYTINFGPNLRWGNTITTLLVPQRSILFGMALALVVFCQWWKVVGSSDAQPQEKSSQLRMGAAGILAGLLPLVHTHTFLVVMITGACLAVIFRRHLRSWIYFFAAAVILALPQVLWLAGAGTIRTSQFFAWQPGWDHGMMNPVWFWFVNAGLFLPVLVLSLIWRTDEYTPSRKLLLFYAPFLLCFIGPNLFKVSPWIWDNIKVLIYWYVASIPVVAWFLATEISRRWAWRWIAVAVLAAMLLSGGFDVIRVITEASPQEEFNIHAVAVVKMIEKKI